MTLVTSIALGMLVFAATLAVFRVVRSDSTIADRMIGVDLLLGLVVAGIAVFAARTGESFYFDLLLVASMLGFVSTLSIGRFLERKNSE